MSRTGPSSCPESGGVVPHVPCLPKVGQDVVIEDHVPSKGGYVPARDGFATMIQD